MSTDNETVTFEPTTPVTLLVHDAANAGKKPKTRWGVVEFNAKGDAELTVPYKDVPLVDQLGWMSADDRGKFLGAVENDAPKDADTAALLSENDALKAANAKLASRNADLEAKFEAGEAKFQKAWTEREDDFAASSKAKDDEIAKLQAALSAASAPQATEAPKAEEKAPQGKPEAPSSKPAKGK
jgi:hypothetical protein